MRTGHLFAGAGGGLYADLILGHRPVFAVEWDDYAANVLRQRAEDGWFPDLHVHHGDVRMFNPSDWKGRVDSIHAGFPCQDISVAGTGAGIEGERSGLWSEVKRVAGEIRPAELFLENSPAITSRGLGTVLGDLAELGYDARWCVLPASAVGAPHLRARWWCLARRPDADSLRELQPQGCQQDQRKRAGNLGKHGKHVSNTNSKRQQKQHTAAIPDGEGQSCGRAIEGWHAGWWSTEPNVGRVADGVANRVNRIKALGNGQVPLQAAVAYMLLHNGFRP